MLPACDFTLFLRSSIYQFLDNLVWRSQRSSCWLLLIWISFAFGVKATSSLAQDVLMHHNDPYRTGVQSKESVLTPADLTTSSFGRLFSLPVDGHVYAQPLWVGGYTMADGKKHDVLYVATEHDTVYALDAEGKPPVSGDYWHTSLLGAGETTVPSWEVGTPEYPGISPEIGVTGTPVIDRVSGVLYVVAKSKLVSAGKTTYMQRLHALSLSTGKEMMQGPVAIQASVPGSGYDSSAGMIAFNAQQENQRAALALAGGSVWIAWAAHDDADPWHGWVIGYNASNLKAQTGAYSTTPNGEEGGIWMSGGGISADSSGNLYAASGNGTFDANTSGGKDISTSVLRMTPGAKGLILTSSFTPYNEGNLSAGDQDLGTSACTLIDNPGGPYPHLLVTTDKNGQIYLVDRDVMGGFMQNSNKDVQDFAAGSGIHQNVAFFENHLYLGLDGAPLSAWSFNPATGLFDTTPVKAPDSSFGCNHCEGGGATPSVSANGTANAIVWAIDTSGYNSTPAIVHAYDAGLSTELYNSTWAANSRDQADIAVKFSTPTIANGYVYVGGASSVTVYGMLAQKPAVSVAPVLSPAAGAKSGAVQVMMTDSQAGAKIYYTVNGLAPSIASPVYSKPITISSTTLLQANAVAPGSTTSSTVGGVYIEPTVGSVFSFAGNFSSTHLTLNGSASIVSGLLQLTDGSTNEASSAYFVNPVAIGSFTTSFVVRMTNAKAAGMTFVLQNQGKTALGPALGLGYGPRNPGGTVGISPSAAVKLDLFNDDGEGPNSTGLYVDGVSPTVPFVDLSATPVNLHSGHLLRVQLSYNGRQLVELVTDIETGGFFQKTYTIDLVKTLGASTALAGFTAGTSSLAMQADVLSWAYSTPD